MIFALKFRAPVMNGARGLAPGHDRMEGCINGGVEEGDIEVGQLRGKAAVDSYVGAVFEAHRARVSPSSVDRLRVGEWSTGGSGDGPHKL